MPNTYLMWQSSAEKSELGSLLFIRSSKASIMVVLLDALSVVTQPIFKRKSQLDPIDKKRYYLFCKPHSVDNKIKNLS